MRILTPGKLGQQRKNSSHAGFTLIELLVTLAIVAVLFAVSASSLRTVFNVDLKNTASRMGSLLRTLSAKAVVDHVYFRMVLDLSENLYYVEESSEPLMISATGEEGQESTAIHYYVERTQLPSSVRFKDSRVSYIKGIVTSGQVAAYFFPDGYATPTLINLKDESDEDHYSIELSPLSGRVRIEGNYRGDFSEEKR